MRRRDIATGLLVAAAPLVLVERASAQTCTQSCYPQTPQESMAGVTPLPSLMIYPPYNVLRYGADPSGGSPSRAAFNKAFLAATVAYPAGAPHHNPIYIPAGIYQIENPGLNWTVQQDIRVVGDGPQQSVLKGDTSSGYTILTISADTGGGTTGLNLNLSDFGIQNGSGGAQNALYVADYIYGRLESLLLQSSGNALKMAGMAQITCSNLDVLTWMSNAAGNSALVLTQDSHGVSCGPLTFSGCEFNGQGNVTNGGAVFSSGTFSTTFLSCALEALGPSLATVADFSNQDDVTLIGCYTESSCNTTGNTAFFIRLGETTAPINFTMIGGHFYSGNGTFSCKYGIFGAAVGQMTIVNTTWANFFTAAITYGTAAPTQILAVNNSSAGTTNPPVFDTSLPAPHAGTVPYWSFPAQTSGWGTPTGAAVVANFPGSSATLAQISEALAEIIVALKLRGIFSA